MQSALECMQIFQNLIFSKFLYFDPSQNFEISKKIGGREEATRNSHIFISKPRKFSRPQNFPQFFFVNRETIFNRP